MNWPARDVALIPTFLAHGLAPRSVLAIRLAGRDSPAADPAVADPARVSRGMDGPARPVGLAADAHRPACRCRG